MNVARECVEEASVPPGLVARLLPVGQVRLVDKQAINFYSNNFAITQAAICTVQ